MLAYHIRCVQQQLSTQTHALAAPDIEDAPVCMALSDTACIQQQKLSEPADCYICMLPHAYLSVTLTSCFHLLLTWQRYP